MIPNINDTTGLYINSTIAGSYESPPCGLEKIIIYTPPEICPHCMKIIKESPDPQYITYIYSHEEQEQKEIFLRYNKKYY